MARVEGGSSRSLLNGDPQEGPLLGDHRPERLAAGRGVLVRRNQAVPVQVAWVPPEGTL